MQRGLPAPGDIIAQKYVISRLLGRGGMGAVYVVEHRVTGKKLALKCLLPEHLEHPEFIERFLREAQAAGRIEHRNVVDVFDVGQEGELLYIVMELLHGKPLSQLLREGQVSLEELLQILLRAMDGVAAAHAVGIVHRDLKPDNILVCPGQSGRLDDPRVLDFGIARLEDDLSKPLTKSGVMLGTPYYMAFEQLNSQRDLDQRVDVYAMGVILYEAIAGQPPYVAESVGSLAIRMMSAPPVALSQLRPELTPGLADVVMRSIARDRDQRYPTMRALIEALKPFVPESASLLAGKGAGTPLGVSVRSARAIDPTLPAMPSPVPSANVESSARLRLHATDQNSERHQNEAGSSRTLLWVALAALVLILGGVSTMLALRASDSEPPAEVASEPAPAAPPVAAPATPPPEATPPTPAQPALAPPPESAPTVPTPSQPTPAAQVAAEPPQGVAPREGRPSRASRREGRGRSRSADEQLDELAKPLPSDPVASPASPPAQPATDPSTGAALVPAPADAPAATPPATEPAPAPPPPENVTPTPPPTPVAPATPDVPPTGSATPP